MKMDRSPPAHVAAEAAALQVQSPQGVAGATAETGGIWRCVSKPFNAPFRAIEIDQEKNEIAPGQIAESVIDY
jgi:hypothetical protein